VFTTRGEVNGRLSLCVVEGLSVREVRRSEGYPLTIRVEGNRWFRRRVAIGLRDDFWGYRTPMRQRSVGEFAMDQFELKDVIGEDFADESIRDHIALGSVWGAFRAEWVSANISMWWGRF